MCIYTCHWTWTLWLKTVNSTGKGSSALLAIWPLRPSWSTNKPTAVNQQKTITRNRGLSVRIYKLIYTWWLSIWEVWPLQALLGRPGPLDGWCSSPMAPEIDLDLFGIETQDAVVLKWPLGRSLTASWKILRAQRNDTVQNCYVNQYGHVLSIFTTTLASKTLANLYANCVSAAWQSYPLDVTLKTLDVSPALTLPGPFLHLPNGDPPVSFRSHS